MRKENAMTTPYRHATAGNRAREEAKKILFRLGASNVGFSDSDSGEVLVYFVHRDKQFQIRISTKGLAAKFLKDRQPHTYRMRKTRIEHEQELLRQACVSVDSAIRDHIKGMITIIES